MVTGLDWLASRRRREIDQARGGRATASLPGARDAVLLEQFSQGTALL
jgi:hypothetical protein